MVSNINYKIFNDIGGRFEARLRENKITTTTTKMREGDVTLTNPIAILDVRFDFDVLNRLYEPSFVGIERRLTADDTSEKIYLIYEIVTPNPIHFQMLGMNVTMPTVIRKEYLEIIESSWGKSDDTWIDVVAVPTNYMMKIVTDKVGGIEPIFNRSRLVPLIGSRAYLLSNYTVSKFLCIEGGVSLGTMIGFDMPLTVSIDNMIRYHTGIFGFTGSGKSNLTSYLVREALRSISDLAVVIFDIGGEYSIHLLDLISNDGLIYTTEEFNNDPARFIASQVIPETLEERISESTLLRYAENILNQNRVRRISVHTNSMSILSLGYIISILNDAAQSSRGGALRAGIMLQKINDYINKHNINTNTDIADIKSEDRRYLVDIIGEYLDNPNDRTALKQDLQALVEYINKIEENNVTDGKVLQNGIKGEVTPIDAGKLASCILHDTPRLSIVYIPKPDHARNIVSMFIDRLFYLKKVYGSKKKVLIVLDEAQEFIPDRVKEEDGSSSSNRAVEALLRQGRKYRLHCWLSTQRVAHLNVNALQQLHTYFVSVLPRFYDRMVIADAFSLSYNILERTTELETGQWLFVSYKATKQKNVPVFIQTNNNEDILCSRLNYSISY